MTEIAINNDPLHFSSHFLSLLTTHLLQKAFPDHPPHHCVLHPKTHLHRGVCASSFGGIIPLVILLKLSALWEQVLVFHFEPPH